MELLDELLDKLSASTNMAIELEIVFGEIEHQSCSFFMEHSERTLENPNDIEQILNNLKEEFRKQLEQKVLDIVDICETNGTNSYPVPWDAWNLIKMIVFERFASKKTVTKNKITSNFHCFV